jgi:hypothetical protein
MRLLRTLAVTGLIFFALSSASRGAAAARDKIAQLQAQFNQEPDPVQKAKLLAKLGDAQLAEAHRAGQHNDYQTVGLLMEKYRDNVREALVALEEKYSDAEKHDPGYRVLEIHVRHSLTDLDETLLLAPPPYRPPLSLVIQDLEDMHEEMLRALFPRRPGEKPLEKPLEKPKAKPASPPKPQ